MFNFILAAQLIFVLSGCCCPCSKKTQEQSQQNAQPPAQEQAPSNQ